MKGKLLNVLFSLCVSAAIVSGHEVLSQAGFVIAVAFNVLAWVATISIPSASEDTINEVIKYRWLTMPCIIVLWVGLVYAEHPYLLASSVLVFLLTRLMVNERKKRIEELKE